MILCERSDKDSRFEASPSASPSTDSIAGAGLRRAGDCRKTVRRDYVVMRRLVSLQHGLERRLGHNTREQDLESVKHVVKCQRNDVQMR